MDVVQLNKKLDSLKNLLLAIGSTCVLAYAVIKDFTSRDDRPA